MAWFKLSDYAHRFRMSYEEALLNFKGWQESKTDFPNTKIQDFLPYVKSGIQLPTGTILVEIEEQQVKSSSGLLNTYVVFVTYYRHPVIDQPMAARLKQIFQDYCILQNFAASPTQVDFMVSSPREEKLSEVIRLLKTVSSQLVRREFQQHLACFYPQSRFWGKGYFSAICGSEVTIEQMRELHYKQILTLLAAEVLST